MTETRQPGIQLGWKALLLIAALPFLSGAAALSHELLWTRRMVDLLGATDWVIGRVLGFFFLGISLGGYFATFQSRFRWPAVKLLVAAEICVAILALPAAFLPYWTDWIWAAIGTENLVSWQGSLIKWLITILVVLPPSIAMGFTLPFFIRATTNLGSNVASVGIWIYAINTLGGVFGLWFTSTYLVQWCGALGSMIWIVAVNVFVGVVLWMLFAKKSLASQSKKSNRSKRKLKSTHHVEKAELGTAAISRRRLIGLSFLSGLIVLSLEVLLLRLISLVVPSSYHTTSALLANVILVLAISSALISSLNTIRVTQFLVVGRAFLAVAFLVAAGLVCFCPFILFEWSDKLMSIRYIEGLNGRTINSVGDYWLNVFWMVAASGGIALLCSGFIFPTLMTMSSSDDPQGKNIGILLAANGIGGLIGCELANSFLIETFGIYQAFSVLSVVILLVGGTLLLKANRWLGIAGIVLTSIAVVVGQNYNRTLPYLSPRSTTEFQVEATLFGREGALLVVEDPKKSKSILVNGQYILGSSGVTQDQRRQLLLPWILHPKADSVCSLGLATGISSSGLESVDDPPPVTAVELSANVEKLARQYFNDETDGFFERSENTVIIEDARTYMAAANEQFDLIVGDLYRPHGSGEGRLYSLEHFGNVRRALTEDGIFCQWLPMYQLNEENWLTVAATFQCVFPETLVVYGNQDAWYPVVGLIGRKGQRKWDRQEIADRFNDIPDEILKDDPLMMSAQMLVVGELDGNALAGQTLNTLDNLKVEISAGNFWILKDLRRDRSQSMQTEFISGRFLIQFNQRLEDLTSPVFSRTHFREFNEALTTEVFRQRQ